MVSNSLSISKQESQYLTVNRKVYTGYKIHEDAYLSFINGKPSILQDEGEYGPQQKDAVACLDIFIQLANALTEASHGIEILPPHHSDGAIAEWKRAADLPERTNAKDFHDIVYMPLKESGRLDEMRRFKSPQSSTYKMDKDYDGKPIFVNDGLRTKIQVPSIMGLMAIQEALDPHSTESSLLNDFPAYVGMQKNKAFEANRTEDGGVNPVYLGDPETGYMALNYTVRIAVPNADPEIVDGYQMTKMYNAEIQIVLENPYADETHKTLDSKRDIIDAAAKSGEDLSYTDALKVLAYEEKIRALNYANAIQHGILTEDNITQAQRQTLRKCFSSKAGCIDYLREASPDEVIKIVHPADIKMFVPG